MRVLFLLCAACAIAPAQGRDRTVFIDAQPEASAVAAQLEKQLSLDGYRIVRGPENAEFALRIDQQSAIDKAFAPAAASAYTLTVVRGKLAGKKVTSLDETCRGLPETPAECHADNFLRDLRDTGELR